LKIQVCLYLNWLETLVYILAEHTSSKLVFHFRYPVKKDSPSLNTPPPEDQSVSLLQVLTTQEKGYRYYKDLQRHGPARTGDRSPYLPNQEIGSRARRKERWSGA